MCPRLGWACLALFITCFVFVVAKLQAQPSAFAQTQDPLMALMLAQPRIDTTSPVVATAVFDPPAVTPGETATYRVTFNALEESIDWPTNISGPPQLTLQPMAHAQILQMAGNLLAPQTTFNTRVRASGLGNFTIPSFVVTVYGQPVRVPPARLYVVPTPMPGVPAAQRLLFEFPATNVFVGEPTRVRIVLPATERGVVQGLTQVQITGDGLLVDQSSARPRIEPVGRGVGNILAFIYELTVTPIATGKLSFFAQAYASGSRFSGPIVMAGPQYTLIESDPVEITVRPLPREGVLPGFTGAIGAFALDPPVLATNVVKVGEPVRLTFAIRGDAGLARLVPPPAPTLRDWQVFASSDHAPLPPHTAPGQAVAFCYTLIPVSTSSHTTPPIPFCYFDPRRPGYEDLTIPGLPIKVLPAPVPADVQAVRQAERLRTEPARELEFSGLALVPGPGAASLVPVQKRPWFPLVQLAPAAAFLILVGWARRQRYREQHPGVVLRQRARRALRREWRALRRAARAGEAPRFAATAVKAMQVACAPHFPAEPRALVGQDVLDALPAPVRSPRVREVVRRFFSVTDANRFAGKPTDSKELLVLAPELDQVLQALEARLCQ
jgi:hypothetical protein